MTICYICKCLVYVDKDDNEDTIIFCSKFCLQHYKNNYYYNQHNYKITSKLCYYCLKKIIKDSITYHYDDKIYCTKECRKKIMYKVNDKN